MRNPELSEAAEAFALVQRARILKKQGTAYDRALRARDRWDSRYATALASVWPKLTDEQIDSLVTDGYRAWAQPVEKVKLRPPRVLVAVSSAVRQALGSVMEFARGALPVYLSLAHDMSEDAGQHSLDQLGLNETFRWTSVRDMPRDMFSVRGSKIIQHAYGAHVDRLTEIIVDATNPAQPMTQDQVRRSIREEWPQITRRDIERIARTEVAAVWNTASVNAYAANEVAWYDWSVARGPGIGPPKSEDVCKRCLKLAAEGPYPFQEIPEYPAHPQCRCIIIPALQEDWLPPAEPWHGNDPPLPLVEAPVFKAVQIQHVEGHVRGGDRVSAYVRVVGAGGQVGKFRIDELLNVVTGSDYPGAKDVEQKLKSGGTLVESDLRTVMNAARAKNKGAAPAPDAPTAPEAPSGKREVGSGAGTEDDPVYAGGDVDVAARALAEGKHVELNQPRQVSTLLAKLRDKVQEMKEKDGKVPDFDLCKVSVPKTNLFCAGHKGIARAQMPQLSGVPDKGTKADSLEKNDRGEVNLGGLFEKWLEEKHGAEIVEERELASHLRASQMQLNGGKVAGIAKALEEKKIPDSPIFVSEEGYVVDGHHRWAAHVGVDVADDKLGDIDMPVKRIVGVDILRILELANEFAEEWGIPQAGVGKTTPEKVK